MAAVVARKTRVGTFGIALCFLAALFFVEAKTTWAVVGGQTSVGIASAKAQAADRSQVVPADAHLAQLSYRYLPPATDVVVVLATYLLTFALLRMNPHFRRGFAHPPACFPFSQSVRPPPTC